MFNLENKIVKLQDLTTGTEGADIPAATLKCLISMSNDVLNDFAPGLRESFFEKNQKEIDQLVQSDMLPDLRYQNMKKFVWDQEFENVNVRIMEEVEQDNVRFIFPDCTIKAFKFGLKQGGTVDVEFNINCKPDEAAFGWLCMHQKKSFPITIEAGEKPQLEGFEPIMQLVPEKQATVMLSPKADKAAEFINDNPGAEVLAVSEYFQLSIKKSEAILSELVDAGLINQVLKGYFPAESVEKQA